MRILKNKVITSLVIVCAPLFVISSGFTDKPKETVSVAFDKHSEKYNLEVLKSPFEVISQEKKNDNKKKKVKKTVKKKHHHRKVKVVETASQSQPVVQSTYADVSQNDYVVNTSSASEEIAMAESSNSYTAQNGRYYGKYQLDISYLHGDLSPANQERVFVQYCNSRYGSVENALIFRQAHGWY